VHEARLRFAYIGYKLCKPDHSSFEKGADKDAPARKRAGVFPGAYHGHSVMGKAPTLTDGSFVIDLADALKK
jgi:hypothetical protein